MKLALNNTTINNKIIIILLIIVLLCATFFIGLNYTDLHSLKKINITNAKIDSTGKVLYSIDSIEKKAKNIIISGWAAKKDTPSVRIKIYLLIKQKDSNTYYAMNTEIKIREDIISNFNNNPAYKNSGFESMVRDTKLKVNTLYEVYILYENDNDDILIPTGKTIKQ
jgi:hypothetical protein